MHEFVTEGEDVTVYPGARIVHGDRIRVGSHVIIDDFVFIGAHAELTIGSYVHIASHASITGGGSALIADFVNISSGARLFTGTDDFSGVALNGPVVPAEFRAVIRGHVRLESHVLVGANAVVLPNVVVGEGAVIGAGSVVTKDLAPWTFYVGAPARALKARPRQQMIVRERELYRRYGRSPGSTRMPPLSD